MRSAATPASCRRSCADARARAAGRRGDRARRSKVQAYFELRDAEGAVPCAIWLNDLEKAGLPEGGLRDGAEVVIGGGPDYYPGGGQASPSFSFRATHVRLAGEGDLLARLEALRKQLRAEGLFELQKQLARPRAAEDDRRRHRRGRRRPARPARRPARGAAGRAPSSGPSRRCRTAARRRRSPRRSRTWRRRPEVEAIVVTRGGGSLADLWAFCDETLCRTVAMLRVPVISAVGHERDSTLIDDVAAVACSTPTHAAEAVVPLDCVAARGALDRGAAALRRAGEGAVGARSRHLVALARGPARALRRERIALNQKTREIRAASERGPGRAAAPSSAASPSWSSTRAARRAAGAEADRRREALRRAEVAFRAHEPERTLERGYALAEDDDGEPVTSAAAALAAGRVRLRFADGRVGAEIDRREHDERDA